MTDPGSCATSDATTGAGLRVLKDGFSQRPLEQPNRCQGAQPMRRPTTCSAGAVPTIISNFASKPARPDHWSIAPRTLRGATRLDAMSRLPQHSHGIWPTQASMLRSHAAPAMRHGARIHASCARHDFVRMVTWSAHAVSLPVRGPTLLDARNLDWRSRCSIENLARMNSLPRALRRPPMRAPILSRGSPPTPQRESRERDCACRKGRACDSPQPRTSTTAS